MRVLVTGGFGFLGQHLCLELGKEHGVIRLPHSSVNILEAEDFRDWVERESPDAIIHLAATCGGIGANRAAPGQFFYENMQMGLNVIETARLFEVKKVVVVGTTCSYPAYTPTPFQERDLWVGYPEVTNAPYGVAKRALITMAQAYREQYGMNIISLIPANLYGPGDNFNAKTSHVIPAIIEKCMFANDFCDTEVDLWGDGTPTREFLHVKDAARGIVAAFENYDSGEPVNLGTGEEIAIMDLANKIAKLTGYVGKFTWLTGFPNGQERRVLDTSRAKMCFGWKAKISLAEGLRDTIAWYKEHR